MDILREITDKRRADIERLGFNFGHSIPEKRTRAVVPFLPVPGTILEIKRASPSKGWIAPELDSSVTAKTYAGAGTSAISVLTEENYFHGTLEDLQKAAKAAGEKVAILRKDFLLEEEEIEIAYRCGADAVLLIGRILETEKLLKMAETAFNLGISVLLEIREDSDIEKAFYALELAHKLNADDKIVLGINSRDLKTFTIDLLIPLRLKEKIRKIYVEKGVQLPFPRIISESGVTSPAAADFVGHLGFHGVLIGEAAARNPEQAKELVKAFVGSAGKSAAYTASADYSFWKKLAVLLENKEKRPLVKICGLKEEEDVLKAAELGADFTGFIFAEKSPRTNELEESKFVSIKEKLAKQSANAPMMIGVIVDPESKEGKFAISLYNKGILDAIQFHGCSDKALGNAGYAAVPLADDSDLDRLKALYSVGFPRVIIDAKNVDASYAQGDANYGGTGKSVPQELVEKTKKLGTLWLSGGVNPENAGALVEKFQPELIDVASGVEAAPGKKDFDKLERLFKAIK